MGFPFILCFLYFSQLMQFSFLLSGVNVDDVRVTVAAPAARGEAKMNCWNSWARYGIPKIIIHMRPKVLNPIYSAQSSVLCVVNI